MSSVLSVISKTFPTFLADSQKIKRRPAAIFVFQRCGRLRQEDCKFKVNLDYIWRPQKTNQTKKGEEGLQRRGEI
jgi:hypothetical protein